MRLCQATLAGAVLLLDAGASAQTDRKVRLQPITSPIRHAGTYHVVTGTWTRGASLADLAGPSVIYDNTCAGVYFLSLYGCERIQHRSRIPSPSGPTTPSTYDPTGFDEAPGCQTQYNVNGFEIAYCSSATTTVGFTQEFASSYSGGMDACAESPMVAEVTFALSGLPGGTPSGAQNCWTVDVDLTGTSESFVLQADGDGSYVGPSRSEQFGWAFRRVPAGSIADSTGPIIAGDYTWTGGPATGVLTPCTGTAGTIWDSPIDLSESGTGMASDDFFRVDDLGPCCCEGGWMPTCWYFGGNPHADFHLVLLSDVSCPALSTFCDPGQGGVRNCPCQNPPSGPGRGCDNFGAHSGGASLSATGIPSLADDVVVFTASGENATALTILLQGDATLPAGFGFGAGVRCVGGSLKRLYLGNASGGSITRPGPGDPTVSQRSAALGDPIGAGETRHYMAYYRDPLAAGPCGSTQSTFNGSQAGTIHWGP